MSGRAVAVLALLVGLLAGVLVERQLVTVHCANAAEGYRAALVRLVDAWGNEDADVVGQLVDPVEDASDERRRCRVGGLGS